MLFKALIKPSSDLGKIEIILRLTAIALLLRPTGPWSVRPVIIALAGLVIVSPKVMRAPGTWFALAGLLAARIVWDWPIPDNHLYRIGIHVRCADGILSSEKASEELTRNRCRHEGARFQAWLSSAAQVLGLTIVGGLAMTFATAVGA